MAQNNKKTKVKRARFAVNILTSKMPQIRLEEKNTIVVVVVEIFLMTTKSLKSRDLNDLICLNLNDDDDGN